MGGFIIKRRTKELKKTKYGYDVSLCDMQGLTELRFEKDEGHGGRASFILTKEDLEAALKLVLEKVRIEQGRPLCCVDGGVLFEKKEGIKNGDEVE